MLDNVGCWCASSHLYAALHLPGCQIPLDGINYPSAMAKESNNPLQMSACRHMLSRMWQKLGAAETVFEHNSRLAVHGHAVLQGESLLQSSDTVKALNMKLGLMRVSLTQRGPAPV